MSNRTIRTTWEAPRWADVSGFVKNTAWELGLECRVDVDKGLIRESGRLEITGTKDKLEAFKKIFATASEQYNC